MKEFKATIVDGTKRKNVTVWARDKYQAAEDARNQYRNATLHSGTYVTNVREA